MKKLKNVEELYCHDNRNIRSINHLKKLKSINIEDTNILEEEIKKLKNLERILCLNKKTVDVEYWKKKNVKIYYEYDYVDGYKYY